MGRYAHLIMVTEVNNNKFYKMRELDNGCFEAEWGRVGGPTPSRMEYPMSKWDSQHKSKLKKGYVDHTHLFAVKTTRSEYAPEDSPTVTKLLETLQNYSKKHVAESYTIGVGAVTKAQIDEAQLLVDRLVTHAAVGTPGKDVDATLLQLFKVLPRRMSDVRMNLFGRDVTDSNVQDLRVLVNSEQNTLDTMRTQVVLAAEPEGDTPTQRLSDALGVSISTIDAAGEAEVKKYLKDMKDRYVSGYRVAHHFSRKRYEEEVAAAKHKDATMYWHGSRNENWVSILKSSLLIRPSCAVATGAMFGIGIYFADRPQKSLGYTSINGSYWARGGDSKAYMALFNVHTGRRLDVKKYHYNCSSLDQATMDKDGYDSVYAHKGADLINDEFIIYKASKCTIEYLVELH